MKKTPLHTSLITTSVACLILFALFMSSRPAGIIDHFKVGDVVYSLLTPTQFTQIHGNGWVLMDGRDIDQQSDLRRAFGWSNVPDARGIFIRGMNVGRDKSTGDAGSDNLNNRAIATYQSDLFSSHSHFLSNGDLGKQRNSDVYLSYIAIINLSPLGHPNHEYALNGTATEPNLFKSSNNGGAETRPRNIALYTYVKIHEQ